MVTKDNIRVTTAVIVSLTIGMVWTPTAFAQRGRGGGGGARQSMGGGGARPSMGGGGARPSMGNMGVGGTRPSMSRPNTPNMSRPSVPNISRPSPSGPSFGNVNVRPSMPSSRPSVPDFGGNSAGRPSRPSLGDASSISRPSTRPAFPPSANLPGIGSERPVTLPGNVNRPVIGGNRPGGNVNLPNVGNNNVVNRPSIGGSRPNIGNYTNINIGNNVNIGNSVGNKFPNRPNWDVDPGFSRPSWGLNGGNNWNDNWHNNCINNHHNWYNGCWYGYWGSNWYAPVVWGGVSWGLGSMTNGWGYNYATYYNPYYAEPMVAQTMSYDYSQPVVVNNYVSSSSEAPGSEAQVAKSTPQQEQALSSFDNGLAKFKAAQYVSSLSDFNAALKELPGDAVVHEVRSLALYAIGDYKAAAAGLNSLLSAAPGMDWTTMSGLYGNPDDYTTQLRKLEQFCRSNPNDASANFVLAYHYLVTGSKEDAINALRVVVKNQPKDVTAKRMLDAMVPPTDASVATTSNPPTSQSGIDTPQTDLVGKWMAKARDTSIELNITEDSKFTWKANAKDQKPIELTGTLSAGSDGITLETKEQGAIGGTVDSKGNDNWRFVISGSPASDPGLSFARVK